LARTTGDIVYIEGRKMDNRKTTVLKISGMRCLTCVTNIERSLKRIPGVLNANVDLANNEAHVDHVPTIATRAKIVKAIREAGYDVVSNRRTVIFRIRGITNIKQASQVEELLSSIKGISGVHVESGENSVSIRLQDYRWNKTR
jgi:Cu+-exporting ATPase